MTGPFFVAAAFVVAAVQSGALADYPFLPETALRQAVWSRSKSDREEASVDSEILSRDVAGMR